MSSQGRAAPSLGGLLFLHVRWWGGSWAYRRPPGCQHTPRLGRKRGDVQNGQSITRWGSAGHTCNMPCPRTWQQRPAGSWPRPMIEMPALLITQRLPESGHLWERGRYWIWPSGASPTSLRLSCPIQPSQQRMGVACVMHECHHSSTGLQEGAGGHCRSTTSPPTESQPSRARSPLPAAYYSAARVMRDSPTPPQGL